KTLTVGIPRGNAFQFYLPFFDQDYAGGFPNQNQRDSFHMFIESLPSDPLSGSLAQYGGAPINSVPTENGDLRLIFRTQFYANVLTYGTEGNSIVATVNFSFNIRDETGNFSLYPGFITITILNHLQLGSTPILFTCYENDNPCILNLPS